MEINITAVSPARRHSTKHAPCWQKTLLCHVAALETILTLPRFLLCSHHADFLIVVGIMMVFPALEVQFFTYLLADVVAPELLLPPCSCKPLFFCLFQVCWLLPWQSLFPFRCILIYSGKSHTLRMALLTSLGEKLNSTWAAAGTPSGTWCGRGRWRRLKLWVWVQNSWD